MANEGFTQNGALINMATPNCREPATLNTSRNLASVPYLWEGIRQKSSRARWMERSEQELKNNQETAHFSGTRALKKIGILLLELPGNVAPRKVMLVLYSAGFA